MNEADSEYTGITLNAPSDRTNFYGVTVGLGSGTLDVFEDSSILTFKGSLIAASIRYSSVADEETFTSF
jgi:hypothetical protein